MNTAAFTLSLALTTGVVIAATIVHADPAADAPPGRTQVDPATLDGWRTWRALACERCHGAEQEGLVGPSLIDSMKQLSKEEFEHTVMSGRPEKGMPGFAASDMASRNLAGLYSYLKGRSEGSIQAGRLEAAPTTK